jgi:ubiquinone/menaquinone biosynthesis C-methylase UbiE
VFSKTADYYDKLYAHKDYRAEADRLRTIIRQERPAAQTLLDVACGTGSHIEHLKAHYQVSGLDLEPGLLDVAQQNHPEVAFYQGDMVDFDLPAPIHGEAPNETRINPPTRTPQSPRAGPLPRHPRGQDA